VLDGDPTITAADDGIRISWSVLSAYQEKVVGFEFCWTDDETTPDFGNKNHRQVFTKQNSIVLPAKLSSEDDTIVVKMKMRAVDRTYQHCTTPKTLTDTNAKKYPGDLATIVTDIKNILAPGNFPTLKAFLEKSVTLSDGMPKGITAVESYMAELAGSYPTPAAHLKAIMQAAVDWKYVRIIAKNDTGHYSSFKAAIEELPADKKNPYTLYGMPGIYNEGEIDLTDKEFSLNIIGLQNVVIKGNIIRSGGLPWLPIENIENIMWITENAKDCFDFSIDEITDYRKTIQFKNCVLLNKYNSAQKVIDILGYIYNVIIDNCYMELTQGLSDNVIELGGAAGETLKLEIINNSVIKNKSASGVTTGLVELEGSNWDAYLFDSIFCGHTATPCIYSLVAGAYLKAADIKYVGAPSWSGTADYGAVHNISNTQFNATSDLDVPQPWEQITT